MVDGPPMKTSKSDLALDGNGPAASAAWRDHREAQGEPAPASRPPRLAKGTDAEPAYDEPTPFQRDLLSLEAAFDRALHSMTVNFQPIVRARTGEEVFGFEALLRPNDRDIPHPGAMLDVAERLGRLNHLGREIRSQVTQRAQDADPSWLIFVNLHPQDLLDPGLASPYSPLASIRDRVVLEITERASLDGIGDIRYRVAELREMGYQIAIDDLGAGHHRMTDVSPGETDIVKLDMSLVREIDRHPGRRSLVGHVTSFCRDQGILIVAEGVETEAERHTLVELGCDLLQGYLFARPGPDLRYSPSEQP